MNGIKNNPVVLDQIGNGCCFLSLKGCKKNKINKKKNLANLTSVV